MNVLPTQDEVIRVLVETGAIRYGHFQYPSGLRSNEYVQVPLAMRYYQYAKMFSVGLSRMLRRNTEIRAMINRLSIVAPTVAGLPIAYGICEALRAAQVYWAEADDDGMPIHFRQYLTPSKGEVVVMVDDILRSGRKFRELKTLLESHGAQVVALAATVYQPTPETENFGDLPIYYLAKTEAIFYADKDACELPPAVTPPERVWI